MQLRQKSLLLEPPMPEPVASEEFYYDDGTVGYAQESYQ